MCMDDIELFAKKEKEAGILKHTITLSSQDIGMEIAWKTCNAHNEK